MITTAQIAWAAGLFDGEGTIFIAKLKREKSRPTPGFNLRLSMQMVHAPTIRHFAATVGVGRVSSRSGYRARDRRTWMWSVSQQKGEIVLRMLLPHLVTKKAEAELALRFCGTPRVRYPKGGTPVDVLHQRQGFYEALKLLKRYEFFE